MAVDQRLDRRAGRSQDGGRQGRDNSQNFDELKGQRTDEIAAKKAGFGSRDMYRWVRQAIAQGIEEVGAEGEGEEVQQLLKGASLNDRIGNGPLEQASLRER